MKETKFVSHNSEFKIKKLTVLGSTGSIGVNTLNIIRNNADKYKVVALAAGRNVELLVKQIMEFAPQLVAVENENVAEKLQDLLGSSGEPEILYGGDGYRRVAAANEADMVVSALAGAAGLLPTLAAIEAGKDIALANKEAMVMAGELLTKRAQVRGSRILPVDSEHSAIFQCLLGHRRQDVRRIILTASGGPFFHLPTEELRNVTPAQAFNHPNWVMGDKITIDSASMMNKGLEAIEAKWLFDVELDNIHILVHPRSIVHSLVEYIDGSMIAQLGIPDMKLPIAYALSFPERMPSMNAPLNLLTAGPLEFFPPDFDKFPNMRLAYEAGRQGGTMPAVLNAANEVAVQAFIEKRIPFPQITDVIEAALSRHSIDKIVAVEDVLRADIWAREIGHEFINKMMK
ncbi:MAG TPA: 1-deoxy-D-xylulose-5-phosphate reductoisomerase [Syntrophales bacterium]|nr:1-deoxy-D-xylulose-5-phosphate reductoisomerase [Syntrophales bacterium]